MTSQKTSAEETAEVQTSGGDYPRGKRGNLKKIHFALFLSKKAEELLLHLNDNYRDKCARP